MTTSFRAQPAYAHLYSSSCLRNNDADKGFTGMGSKPTVSVCIMFSYLGGQAQATTWMETPTGVLHGTFDIPSMHDL